MVNSSNKCYPWPVRVMLSALGLMLATSSVAVAQVGTSSVGATDPLKKPASDDPWDSGYDDFDHVLQLDQLNRRADEVQRRIAAIDDRVKLLRESVIIGSITPSKALIIHRNEMGRWFTLERVEYFLDGKALLERTATEGDLDKKTEFELLNGRLTPGEHLLEVKMVFVGTGNGLFDYFDGFRFNIGSKYKLNVAEGRLTRLDVVAFPRREMGLKPNERLAIKYDLDIQVLPGFEE